MGFLGFLWDFFGIFMKSVTPRLCMEMCDFGTPKRFHRLFWNFYLKMTFFKIGAHKRFQELGNVHMFYTYVCMRYESRTLLSKSVKVITFLEICHMHAF